MRIALGALCCLARISSAQADDDCGAVHGASATRPAGPAPGYAVAVVAGGVLRCTSAVGMADLEASVPITDSTLFNLASVAKQLTAYAAARAAATGRVDLDRAIGPAIAGGAASQAKVTLRQMLAHTAGLRDIETLLPMSGARPEDAVTQADAVAVIRRQRALNFPPGERFLYSNSGYVLAAELLAAQAGAPFEAILARDVFAAAGMRDTLLVTDPRVAAGPTAASYAFDPEAGRWQRVPYGSTLLGSTNVLSSARDMGAWAVHLLRLARTDDAAVSAMTTPACLNDGSVTAYGLGLELGSYRGLDAWRHGGRQAGYRSAVMLLPSIDGAVVVLGNGSARLDWMVEEIADRYFGPSFRDPPTATAANAGPQPATPLAAEVVGIYEIEPGLTVAIETSASGLTASMDPAGTIAVSPAPGMRLVGPNGGLEFRFDDCSNGRCRTVHVTGLGPALGGERRRNASPSPAELESLAGAYTSPELLVTYAVAVRDGQLSVQMPHLPPLPLEAIEGGQFVLPAVGLSLHFSDGETMFADTWRAKGLTFDRTPAPPTP